MRTKRGENINDAIFAEKRREKKIHTIISFAIPEG
jgi:hypothetical protein